MSARLLSKVVAFTASVALLIMVAPPALAQPAEPPEPAVNTTMPLADVGSDSDLWFYDETSVTTLSFPVPTGLKPATLNGTMNLPFRLRSGTLTVTQDDRLISKIELPLADFAPVVIPLDAIEVSDDSVNVTLRLTALAEDGYCLDHENPVGIINNSVTYTGIEIAPGTVADFLPSILRTLTIGLPDKPSRAESDAAVQLAAALQSRYRGQAPQVVLVPLAPDSTTIDGPPPPPTERRIVIKEGPDKGLSLLGGGTVLLISGPADDLTNQTRLLTDGSLSMALSTKVVAEKLRSNPILPGDSTTLAQLGQPSLSNIGVSPQVGIQLDQTRFGHSTQGFRVHVTGSHTPVPAEIGAQMTASVDNEIIDSWPASDGNIDHWIDVPDRLVARYTNVVVAVDTSGYVGRCGDFRPITLTVDGSTVVQSSLATPPIPAGFVSLPQALMPRIRVGINEDSFVDTVRATQIVVGLQRLSVVPLQTEVSSVQEAIDSDDPAVVISPDGWANQSIALPVSEKDEQLNLMGIDGSEVESTLTVDPSIRFGSLQTVVDGQRSLLVATSNGAPAQLDELLRWLSSDPKGWSKLRGSVVVAIEGRPPQLVPGRDATTVYGPDAPSESAGVQGQSQSNNVALGVGVGVIAAVAIGVTAFWLGTRRRSRNS
jgi:hypothetical protein